MTKPTIIITAYPQGAVSTIVTDDLVQSCPIETGAISLAMYDGRQRLGTLQATEHQIKGTYAIQIEDVALTSPGHKGKGLGLAMYEAMAAYAANRGLMLASDTLVSAEAAHVWQALMRRGWRVVKHADAALDEDGEWTANCPVFRIEAA